MENEKSKTYANALEAIRKLENEKSKRYANALEAYRAQVKSIRSFGRDGDSYFQFVEVLKAARPLIDWALRTREIPVGKEGDFERAARVFGSLRRPPKNLIVWHDRNRSALDFLTEMGTWPEKREAFAEIPQVAKRGAFALHNSIGASEEEFEKLLLLLERADSLLRAKFDFEKVLYGDVFVVGQIKQRNHLAWYMRKEDTVFLRVFQGHEEALHSLLHELGHRYWWKFHDEERVRRASRLYYELRKPPDVSAHLPKVGEMFPCRVRRDRPVSRVVRFERGMYRLESGDGVTERRLREHLERRTVLARFPTPYSITNLDEFFAECFAFYSLSKLNESLASAFESVIEGDEV